jgi:hypothetical protein
MSLRGEAEAIISFQEIATHPSGARKDRKYRKFNEKSLSLGSTFLKERTSKLWFPHLKRHWNRANLWLPLR